MERVCVYCGSNGGTKAQYVQAAGLLGKVLAERGIGLVYGGGSIGVMGALARGALQHGGEVIGVTPQIFIDMGVVHLELTDLKVTKDMHERKATMAELADGFIALPGGLGTLEELFEALTWGQIGFHAKPVGLLNVAGYYDKLIDFLEYSVQEQFIKAEHNKMLLVDENPTELLDRLEAYTPPKVSKIYKK